MAISDELQLDINHLKPSTTFDLSSLRVVFKSLSERAATAGFGEEFWRNRHNMRVVSISLYTALCSLAFTFATPEDENVVTAKVTRTITICPISGTWTGSARTAYTIVSNTDTSTQTSVESSEPERSLWPHATFPSSEAPSTLSDTVLTSTHWATATVFKILEKNETSDKLPEPTGIATYFSQENTSTLATLASHSFRHLNHTGIGSHALFSGTSGDSLPSAPTLPVSTSSFVSSGARLLHPWYFALIAAFAFAP